MNNDVHFLFHLCFNLRWIGFTQMLFRRAGTTSLFKILVFSSNFVIYIVTFPSILRWLLRKIIPIDALGEQNDKKDKMYYWGLTKKNR